MLKQKVQLAKQGVTVVGLYSGPDDIKNLQAEKKHEDKGEIMIVR